MDDRAVGDPRGRGDGEAVARVQLHVAGVRGLQRAAPTGRIDAAQALGEQCGAEAPPPCRGADSEGRKLPRLGRPWRQLGGEEDVETVAQQVGDPCLRRVRRGGGMRAEQGGHPVQVLTHENDATAQGVLEVDRLQFLESLGMVVLGDRPPCPRVVVEGRGESVRSGGQVGGAGIAERVRHSGTVVQLVRGAVGRCVHDDSRICARSTSNSHPERPGRDRARAASAPR